MTSKTILKRLKKIILDKKIYLTLILLLIVSCNQERKLKKQLKGVWLIDKINYNGSDFIDSLHFNGLTFREKTINIPQIKGYSTATNPTWRIHHYNNTDTLVINSENKIFNGKYELMFAKDSETNIIYARLTSIKTYILIQQANFSY